MAGITSRRLLGIYAVLVVVFAFSGQRVQQVVFHVSTAAVVVAVLYGIRRHRPAYRKPWYAFAAAAALGTIGAVSVSIFQLPKPSFADGLFVASYLCLACGLLMFAARRLAGGTLVAVVDGLAAALSFNVVAWTFVLDRYADQYAIPVQLRVTAVTVPLLDVALLALYGRLVAGRAKRSVAHWLIGGSLLSLCVTDFVNAPEALRGLPNPSTAVAVGWLVTFAFCGAAALHPSMAEDNRVTERLDRFPRVRYAVLGLAVLTTPAVIASQSLRHAHVDVALLRSVEVVIIALVLVRLAQMMRLTVSALRRANASERRHRVLADASAQLVAATNDQAVYEAVAQGAWTILDGGARDRVLVGVPDGTGRHRVLAAAGHVSAESGGQAVGRLGDSESAGELFVVARYDADTAAALETLVSEARLALSSVRAIEEQQRERGARLFGALVGNSADAIAVVGGDRVLRYASPAADALLGRPLAELDLKALLDRVHADDTPGMLATVDRVLSGGAGATGNVQCRVRHETGTLRVVEVVLTNLLDDPDVEGVVANARDVTERRSLEDQLARQALHDALTDLPNRTLFGDRVGHAIRRRQSNGAVAVLFVDLDDFKVVNDSLGHRAGDELLRQATVRLRQCARPDDTVARLGGDEFAILIEDASAPDVAQRIAERALDALRPAFVIGGEEVEVTASIGIAIGSTDTAGEHELLRDADLAMYMAKRQGKGCYQLYDPSMYEAAVRRRQLAAELRTAIESDQLVLHYQPIVDVHSTRVDGVEALVRWQHPARGLIPPGEFIPLAEDTGLVIDLGRAVLRRACGDVQAWRDAGLVSRTLYVSVNISASHLALDSLVRDAADALEASGLPAAALVVEITETTLMQDVELAAARLRDLKQLGVRVAVDDFGTGFSSLSYLSRFDVDILKIDKSFVDRVTADAEGVALVRAVIDLGRALSLDTVAEGIEEGSQLAVLDQLGCDHGQGYFLARPMPPDALTALLASSYGGALLAEPYPAASPKTRPDRDPSRTR